MESRASASAAVVQHENSCALAQLFLQDSVSSVLRAEEHHLLPVFLQLQLLDSHVL